MAKRFTDTDKWKKPWFRKLKPIYKIFWIYLTDNCDKSGIWEVDFELAQMFIGKKLNIDETKEAFSKQFIELDHGKRWFLVDFVEFQYGELNKNNPAHKNVIKDLSNRNLLNKSEGASEGLQSTLEGTKDKDKDKDKEKDKGKGKDKDKRSEGLETVKKLWNNFAKENNLQQVIKLTDKRMSGIKNRLDEKEFDLNKIFDLIKGSDFLLGKIKEWKVDFDFIFCSQNNYLKILEGKYNNQLPTDLNKQKRNNSNGKYEANIRRCKGDAIPGEREWVIQETYN